MASYVDITHSLAFAHSRNSSLQSTASENWSPITPIFSTRHSRYSSSNSSLSSTPPSFERGDALSPLKKSASADKALSDVVEDPLERETDFDSFNDFTGLFHDQTNSEDCERTNSFTPSIAPDYDLSDGILTGSGLGSSHIAKRRRSGESPFNSIATRIGTRFPSLTKKWKERKTSAKFVCDMDLSAAPSRAPLNRASSTISPIYPALQELDQLELLIPGNTIPDAAIDAACSSVISIAPAVPLDEPIDRKALASTPLLPPVLTDLEPANQPSVQSPLQSPTVVESSGFFSPVDSPVATPKLPATATPPLSRKQSIASFYRSRIGQAIASSDIIPIGLTDTDDEWDVKLGHANFTIEPEPYMPEICDKDACERMRVHYEQAQCNYIKHLVRTSEHFGATSKVYKLTEEKWAQIDAQWKKNSEIVAEMAGELVDVRTPRLSAEGALGTVPSFNDPKSEGKFPKLGDEDIVGPMVQIASQINREPSRKGKFFKLLGEYKARGGFAALSSVAFSASLDRSR